MKRPEEKNAQYITELQNAIRVLQDIIERRHKDLAQAQEELRALQSALNDAQYLEDK